jgi:hypothetical protein
MKQNTDLKGQQTSKMQDTEEEMTVHSEDMEQYIR